jgi:radical SAM protein with 4Fe4S-binding SPASM domain
VLTASEHGIYTQTSTNGQLLDEDMCRRLVERGLDRIIISLDGVDQGSYSTYRRGGEISRVEAGIRTLNRLRSELGSTKPYIIVQFLVFSFNQHQVQDVKNIARQWGADRVWIKSAQVEYPDPGGDWIPEGSSYSRYERSQSGEWRLRSRLRNRCRRLWETTVVTSDGIVVPCCFDKLAVFPMGTAGEQDFKRIWKNRSYTEFRKRVLTARSKIAICKNCTEGLRKV